MIRGPERNCASGGLGRLLATGCALLVLAAACVTAPPHPYFIAPGHEGAPDVDSILLLPLNVVVALPAELRDSAPSVARSIGDLLESSGKTVQKMDFYDAGSAWAVAAREVRSTAGSEQEFGTVARQFALRIREFYPYDALVIPSLVYRQARIYEGSRYAVWDGVKRPFEFASEAQMHGSIHLMTTVAGTMPGVSLHVLVYDPSGRQVFASYGGIDVVHDFDLQSDDRSFESRMPLKSDRLIDEAVIREGVRLAFDPYLAPPMEAQNGE